MTDTPTIYTNPQTLAAAVVELLENRGIGSTAQPVEQGSGKCRSVFNGKWLTKSELCGVLSRLLLLILKQT